MGEQTHQTTNGNTIEETWLCTHCGTPYTRKVRQEKELLTDHRAAVPTSNTGHSVERLLDQRVVHQETVVPASNTGHSVERLLDQQVVHQETVVPASKAGRSMERPLERVAHQETVVPASKAGGSVERPLGTLPNQVKRGNVSASPRGRSQLWQDSSFGEEIESFLPRYPRSRKKSILLGLLIFILIAASVVSGALWQLQGINPLEILVYWRM
jgi:hypothetical protein